MDNENPLTLKSTGFRCFISYLKRNESKVGFPSCGTALLYEGGR